MPFLENVVRGKPVPRERLLEVAEHYYEHDGVSPINEQNRKLLSAIEADFQAHEIDLPVYWGNRNWKPTLTEALAEMKRDGRKRALAFFTSMFSCYSGCRQYRENILSAQEEISDSAPQVEKVRMGFNHPGFITAMAERVKEAHQSLPQDLCPYLVFTAHSIPLGMAKNCSYEVQLQEASRLVAAEVGIDHFDLCYQSRSGPPQQPWLEPDICDLLEAKKEEGIKSVILVPIGFVSDHMEVIHDLDHEAAERAQQLGLHFRRAGTVGTHPRFIEMIRELVLERLGRQTEKRAIGSLGPWHDVCPVNCCLYERPSRP